MIGSWQGFSLALMNFLRIPPGVGVRKSNGDERSRGSENLASFEFIDTIVDITADDVLVGRRCIVRIWIRFILRFCKRSIGR